MIVLIVGPQERGAQQWCEALRREGHQCRWEEDVAAIRADPPGADLIVVDQELLENAHIDAGDLQAANEPILLIAPAEGGAAAAARLGGPVRDYLCQPVDLRELVHLVAELAEAEPVTRRITADPDGLVVGSDAMRRVVDLADRIHRQPDMPVLLIGETGTGKELLARRIHHGGGRRNRDPFIAINCAAIAPGLFEAELFGYEAGAFTGARSDGSTGKLAAAGNGTVMLDEIAELPGEQQAKLLRVLEERSWYPVGSTRLQGLQARLICASNEHLIDRVAAGTFRADLFYRLKVATVEVPPLRERREEILPLVRHFIIHLSREHQLRRCRIAADAQHLLSTHPWPGNVRQLRHFVEELLLHHEGADVGRHEIDELLSQRSSTSRPALAALSMDRLCLPESPPPNLQVPAGGFDLDAWYGAIIRAALIRCDHSPVRTAEYLGITRKVLYTLRKRYGLLEG